MGRYDLCFRKYILKSFPTIWALKQAGYQITFVMSTLYLIGCTVLAFLWCPNRKNWPFLLCSKFLHHLGSLTDLKGFFFLLIFFLSSNILQNLYICNKSWREGDWVQAQKHIFIKTQRNRKQQRAKTAKNMATVNSTRTCTHTHIFNGGQEGRMTDRKILYVVQNYQEKVASSTKVKWGKHY